MRDNHPHLAYLHAFEPRISGREDADGPEGESNAFLREIWGERPLILAGGINREGALDMAEKNPGTLVGFGRYFISNVSALQTALGC